MNIKTSAKRFIDKLTGEARKFDLSPFEDTVQAIEAAEHSWTSASDQSLREAGSEIIREVRKAGSADRELLIRAYALVREVCKRKLGMRPYRVQLIAGIALYEGKLAEMKTGEGKTLAAVMPVFLKAAEGKGVHVLTFNDYLARRDALWMGACI